MKQKHTKVPYFSAGQVLTSATLNDFFGYNDEQMRITRNDQIGIGIVKGLTYKYDGKNFTIEPGYGYNNEGNLICLEEERVYSAAILNEDKKSYTLSLSKKRGITVNIPKDIDKYLVCIEWSNASTKKSNCNRISCDYQLIGKSVDINIHLIPQNKDNVFKAFNILQPREEFVRLESMRDWSAMLNTHLMRKKITPLFHRNREKINKGLLAICHIMNPNFLPSNNKIYPLNCWIHFMPLCPDLVNRLMKTYYYRTHGWHEKMVDIPQYYLQHLEDLALAINDTLRYYNDMIGLYPMLPTSVKSIKEQTLVLGYGNNQDRSTSCERQYYWNNQSAEAYHAVLRLQHMIMRVILLCEKFSENDKLKRELKFLWYNPNAAWSLRPIPYYYSNSEELKKYWNAPELSPVRYTDDYFDAPEETEVTDSEGRLFLQGHLNKDPKEVKEKIEAYSQKYQLNINVEIVEVCKKILADKRKHRNDVGGNILELFENHVDSKPSQVSTPKQGADASRNGIIMTGNDLVEIREMIKDVVKDAQTNTIIPTSKTSMLNSVLNKISIDEIKEYLIDKMKDEYGGDNKIYEHHYIRAFDSFRTYLTKSYNEAYRYSKMVNGYKENSTIVLFSYKKRIIYDVCL